MRTATESAPAIAGALPGLVEEALDQLLAEDLKNLQAPVKTAEERCYDLLYAVVARRGEEFTYDAHGGCFYFENDYLPEPGVVPAPSCLVGAVIYDLYQDGQVPLYDLMDVYECRNDDPFESIVDYLPKSMQTARVCMALEMAQSHQDSGKPYGEVLEIAKVNLFGDESEMSSYARHSLLHFENYLR